MHEHWANCAVGAILLHSLQVTNQSEWFGKLLQVALELLEVARSIALLRLENCDWWEFRKAKHNSKTSEAILSKDKSMYIVTIISMAAEQWQHQSSLWQFSWGTGDRQNRKPAPAISCMCFSHVNVIDEMQERPALNWRAEDFLSCRLSSVYAALVAPPSCSWCRR